MIEVVRSLIFLAAIHHPGADAAKLDCIAFKESTWGSHSPNVFQLMSPGIADDFYAWETAHGLPGHDLDDPSRQANFMSDYVVAGKPMTPWTTWDQCRARIAFL